MRFLNRILFGSIFVLTSNLASAGVEHEHDHHDDHSESLGAHVHGEAQLMIAYEGSQLQMLLHSPAGNIVGFEHRISSSEEQVVLDAAQTTLNTPEKLFVFDAVCSLVEQSIDLSALERLDTIHDDHDHDDEHEYHHEDEHDHTSEHAEVMAEYTFECGEPVLDIRVELLNAFPGIERLHVQWVTESGQGAIELSESNLNVVLNQ